MSRKLHRFLNAALPKCSRRALKRAALASIPSLRHYDMPTRLRRLQQLGFDPRSIVDVGAGSGQWAQMAADIWPSARIFGVEPNLAELPLLEQVRDSLSNFDFVQGVLGPQRRAVQYRSAGHQTSLLDSDTAATETAQMYVLDEMVAEGRILSPQFIKLDVQGFELEVLRGAANALRACDGVLLEVNLYEFLPGAATVAETMAFFRERDFVLYDVAGVLRRPSDDALWQMDMVFLPVEHRLREQKEY